MGRGRLGIKVEGDIATITQTTLRRKASNSAGRVERWRAGNLEAAEIILADIGRYGGESAALAIWSRAVLARDAAEQDAWRLTA